MSALALYLLAAYGATNILTGSYLLAPVRDQLARHSSALGHFSECPMCVGFWVGLVLAWPAGMQPALGACASSGFCWIARVVLRRLGEDET